MHTARFFHPLDFPGALGFPCLDLSSGVSSRECCWSSSSHGSFAGGGEIQALNDVDKMLVTSAPAKPAARRSSSRRPAAAATPVAETASDAKPTRKRRPMTAEEKKAVSERMTASWAERRKKAAK